MNIYVVVEGETEKKVYPSWIPLVNPNLTQVDFPNAASTNNYYIISGMGNPQYFEIIEDAIRDVNYYNFYDRLIICIDSEDMTRNDKYDEVLQFISGKQCSARIIIVVQHFCIETWALGNKRVVRPDPRTETLRLFKRIFNVRNNDPELLPPYPERELNRAQFAEKYLRAALNDRYRNLSYNKGEANVISHMKYFEQIKNRRITTNHIKSFSDLLTAFV